MTPADPYDELAKIRAELLVCQLENERLNEEVRLFQKVIPLVIQEAALSALNEDGMCEDRPGPDWQAIP